MAKEVKEKKVKKQNKSMKVKNKESYLKGVRKELKQVKWPSFKEIIKYTFATVVFCIILVLFFELIKLGMAYVRGLFN